MNKRVTLTIRAGVLLLLICGTGYVQAQDGLHRIAYTAGQAPGWMTFHDHVSVSPKAIFETYGSAFGLGSHDEMRLVRVQQDALGMTHHRYQQYHRGVKVEGGEYIVHARDNRALRANGYLPTALPAQVVPAIDATAALQAALEYIAADRYMWEDPFAEAALQNATDGQQQSYYPQAELVIADLDWERNDSPCRLAWKFDIYAAEPHTRKLVYVDAQTGLVFKDLESLHSANATGTAVTRYSGPRSIVADSMNNGTFRLRETNRGAGVRIETYDLNQSTNVASATDFFDDDNYWDNVNPQHDDAATDAHWGAEMTYDYFYQVHNRNSYNDQGSPLVSYVHFDTNYFNAFWNGQWMTYGDGNNNPLTTLDVVAHEIAHGVTGNSAGLIYAYESGALNESFSDIFGNTIERFGVGNDADWRIGEGFGAFRNMANPNAFGNPDTYKGSAWSVGTFDNGGVHINSGVQNYWYYLLVEGGSGTNDLGKSYQVTGIGLEKAAQIAYRNLTVYLTSTSQFIDAREGSLLAAADLYGACSQEYISVIDAWHAVGLGEKIQNEDFGVISIEPLEPCALGAEEQIQIRIKYFGCDTFPGGDLLAAYFIQTPNQAALEVISLPPVTGQQVLAYTFSQTADLSAVTTNRILSRTLYTQDPIRTNDSSDFYFIQNTQALGDDLITFEGAALNPGVIRDTLFMESGEESSLRVQAQAGRAGSYGLLMEGGDRDGYQFYINNFDAFAVNPAYTSRACMCVDATEMDTLLLSFDLRQTFSPFLVFNAGRDSSEVATRVNQLRVTVNGLVRARFSPLSHSGDPFRTHTLSLRPFLGSILHICFEGNTNQSLAEDNFNIGDRIFLDNIWLNASYVEDTTTTAIVPQLPAEALTIAPNPSDGRVSLRYTTTQPETLTLELCNTLGQVLRREMRHVAAGTQTIDWDLSHEAQGIYLLRLRSDQGTAVRRLVLTGER
ncbi:MAG: hypothetical protein OHK0039_15800 [Bacteroidia bacterium]